MFAATVADLLQMTGGTLLAGSPQQAVQGLSTDSRTLQAGEIFVALRGEHFDGHRFIQDAVHKGAAALVVETFQGQSTQTAVIRVADSLRALGDIAHAWRTRHAIPIVAITGTSGKTTTKDLVRDCLASAFNVLATEGNFNNLIGVPKTLLQLTAEHESAVIEMGMNRFGEIRRLAEIAAPQYGLITAIGAGHTEGVGSVAGVAKAKGELLEAMGEEGFFFANWEDATVRALAAQFSGDVLSYGFSRHCDVFAHDLSCADGRWRFRIRSPWEEAEFQSEFWGKHHVLNATAAVAVAQSFHVPMENCVQVVETMTLGAGRGALIRLGKDIVLLDDSYNANPLSVRAALAWFTTVGPRFSQKIFVFGTMFELGECTTQEHLAIVDESKTAGVTDLYLYGEFADVMAERAIALGFSQNCVHCFQDVKKLSVALQNALIPGTAVAIKASHACGFDALIKGLEEKR